MEIENPEDNVELEAERRGEAALGVPKELRATRTAF
jgi:hypothetical protein